MGMDVKVEVAALHARPNTMPVMGNPGLRRLRHPRTLNMDGCHVHDWSGPRRPFPKAVIRVAPDEIVSAPQPSNDAGNVVEAAFEGEVAEVQKRSSGCRVAFQAATRARIPGRWQGRVSR